MALPLSVQHRELYLHRWLLSKCLWQVRNFSWMHVKNDLNDKTFTFCFIFLRRLACSSQLWIQEACPFSHVCQILLSLVGEDAGWRDAVLQCTVTETWWRGLLWGQYSIMEVIKAERVSWRGNCEFHPWILGVYYQLSLFPFAQIREGAEEQKIVTTAQCLQ